MRVMWQKVYQSDESRMVTTLAQSPSFDFASDDLHFDWFLAVFFSRDFDL